MVKNLPGKIIMGNISAFALEYESPMRVKNMAENCLLDGANIGPAWNWSRTPLVKYSNSVGSS